VRLVMNDRGPGEVNVPRRAPSRRAFRCGWSCALRASALGACVACSGATADEANVRIGEWTGTTADGEALEFTVETLGVTRVAFDWRLPCAEATPARSSFSSDPQPIVGRELIFTDDLGAEADLEFSATFETDSLASGRIKVETHGGGSGYFCEGRTELTWTAAFSHELE
jgi:hypothetical protein